MANKLFYETKNVFSNVNKNTRDEIYDYAEGYKTFLAKSKTEREAVTESIKLAKKNGFKEYNLGDKIKKGGKYYLNNRGKSLYLFSIGTKDIEEDGIRISAAHIDSPRLDLKQNPLYEDSEIAYLKTHYYGGIKKYQWTAVPLALHGVICKKDGTTITVCIGDKESDPIFYVSDLLIHLAKDQMAKTLAEGVTAESLNIIIGSEPKKTGTDKDRVKAAILDYLHKEYGIDEADFLSAELTAVPAYNPRDIGFDRSLIGAYGHDDKVCAYPAVTAIIDASKVDTNQIDLPHTHTLMTILADKEEIGSEGTSGMKCAVFMDLIDEICAQLGANSRRVRQNSKCLSADVNSAYDPNYAECFEKKNCSYVGHGVVMTKYTGARGKSGSNDASAEYIAFLRNIFEKEKIIWQSGELGKVDQGGGGTVALMIAEKNIETIDLGVAVLSMHAPMEVIAKSDLYMTYKAFYAFNK